MFSKRSVEGCVYILIEKWIPLHIHSEYSALDGAIKIHKYVKWAEANDIPAIAVTDHGIMSGHVELDKETQKSSVKAIYGCEIYTEALTSETLFPFKKPYHLLILAKNEKGHKNLMKLVTESHRNFKKKPLATWEMLEKYAEGLFVSTACIEGEIPVLLKNGFNVAAKELAMKCKNLFNDDFRIELVDTGFAFPDQIEINKKLFDFSEALNIPCILTTDSHYMFPQDREWHEALLAAQTKKVLADPTRFSLSNVDLSLRTGQILHERWGTLYEKAILETAALESRFERYTLAPKGFQMPVVTGAENLREMARKGLDEVLSRAGITGGKADYYTQLETELDVVENMGFASYFIMVSDLVAQAKARGILVGPGRGSAAGSVLSWSLGITSVDPVKYGLLFERFLNSERISMPDIDLDFEDERRKELVDYLREKYGENSVSPIISYSFPEWKNALKDAARVLGYSPDLANRLTKTVDPLLNIAEAEKKDSMTVMEEIVQTAVQHDFQETDIRKIADLASNIRGVLRQYGRHAAGMVIVPGDITDYVPLCHLTDQMVTQYDMLGIEYMNLIKMDLLGLSTLTQLRHVVNESVRFDPHTPTPEDLTFFLNGNGWLPNILEGADYEKHPKITKTSVENTLRLLSSADTTGVFQLGSHGMRKLLRQTMPKNMEDLSALIALYRPGPLSSGMTDAYVMAKRNTDVNGLSDNIESPFPESVRNVISKLASDTFGIVIYQEHVMKCAREIAGYSLAEADLRRRAMGKKKTEVMEQEKEHFISMAEKKGINNKDATEVFETLAHFSNYGFNKSHATVYAFLSFITAWYKANRPQPFFAALIEDATKKDRETKFVPILRETMMTTRVFPPSLTDGGNREKTCVLAGPDTETVKRIREWKSEDELWKLSDLWGIRLGLHTVKGLGTSKIDLLSDIPFDLAEDIEDLFVRISGIEGLSAKFLISLFESGLLDGLCEKTLENHSFSHAMSVPFFRVGLLCMKENTAVLTAMVESLDPLFFRRKKDETMQETALSRIGFDRKIGIFGSYLATFFERLRAAKQRKRNPLSEEDGKNYVKHHMERILCAILSFLAEEWQLCKKDSGKRLEYFQLLFLQEKKYYSDGLLVPEWRLVAEQLNYKFDFYADELGQIPRHVLERKAIFKILGYYQKITLTKKKERLLLLSGRYGDATQVIFIKLKTDPEGNLTPDIENIFSRIPEGIPVCVECEAPKNSYELKFLGITVANF